MKVRKLFASTLTIAMAFANVEANLSMQKAYADSEEVKAVDEVSSTDEPKCGDLIWITDEEVTYWASDKMFKAVFSDKIQYDIFIIGRYDDENWRVYVPMMNEPERVILLPVNEYNITVLSHDHYVIGDLNRDNQVDVFDLALLKKWIVSERDFKLDDYSDIEGIMDRSIDRQDADINSDSVIDVRDIVCMQQYLLGVRKTFRD